MFIVETGVNNKWDWRMGWRHVCFSSRDAAYRALESRLSANIWEVIQVHSGNKDVEVYRIRHKDFGCIPETRWRIVPLKVNK